MSSLPMPAESERQIVTAYDHDAFWFSETGAAVPSWIAESFDIVCPASPPVEKKLVCLAEAPSGSIAAGVKRIRARIGEDAYLILMFAGDEEPENAIRVLDYGADDVVTVGDGPSLRFALARGERQLFRLRRAAALERGLKIERDFLQACIDNIPTPIFFKNSRGIYVGCNRAFESYLGLSAASIIGSSVYEVAPDQCAEIYAKADADLLATGGQQAYEAQVRYADGSIRDVAFRKAVITDEQNNVRGLAGAMIDITERKRLEMELADAAARDPLTNIFNRRHFFRHIENLAATAVTWPATIAVVDIDHFKTVNDRFGHAAGDAVLRAVASLLETRLSGGIVARAGGEEFFVCLPGVTAAAAADLMEDTRRHIGALIVEDGSSLIAVTASIGIAEYWPAREALWDCLRRADAALYQSKNGGRNRLSLAA